MTKLPGKRIEIITESEMSELYSIPLMSDDDRQHFFSLNDTELKVFNSRESVQIKTYFILLLGYFKYKPIILDFTLKDVKADLDYILQTHLSGKKLPRKGLTRQQKSKLYQLVLRIEGYKPFTGKMSKELTKRATEEASICVEPRHIFDECVDFLSYRKVSIPAYSTLQLIVTAALQSEQHRTETLLHSQMPKKLTTKIEQIISPEGTVSLLTTIKTLPKDFTRKELTKEILTFKLIKEIYPSVTKVIEKLRLSKSNVDYYASLVDFYTITKLRRFSFETAALYIICYLHQRYKQINDNFVNAFIYHVRKITDEANTDGKTKVYEALKNINDKMKQASSLLNLYIDDDIDDTTPFKDVRKKAFAILSQKEIPIVRDYLSDIEMDKKRFEWEYIDRNKNRIKGVIRSLFECMKFSERAVGSSILKQVEITQLELANSGKMNSFDPRLITKQLKPYLTPEIDGSPEIILHRAEIYLYRRIKDRMDSGDLFVPDSLTFKKFEADLLDDKSWKDKKALIATCNLPSMQIDINELIDDRLSELDNKLTEVSERLKSGENRSVVFTDRSGKIKWTIRKPKKGHDVNNPFFEKLTQTHIGDVMAFVNRETDFFSAFTHINTHHQKKPAELGPLIACIVANGTRFGANKMADICDLTFDKMRTTQKNFLRMETLHNANDIVSNAIAKLPIFQHYNIQKDLLHASSDGQKFESRKSTMRTRFSSKYLGRGKGLSNITLSANHVPVNAKLMGLNEHESHYVFDLLYNNTSDIQPDMLSTDFHGTNQVNFALLDLFGWKFAPRYPKFGKVIDDLFVVSEDENARLLNLRRPIRRKIICDDWDFVQRIVLSLQRKETTQSIIVKKLSSYKSNSKLFLALIEYDRLIKSLFVLNYMDDESLRHYVHRALNRGEAYHQLQRKIESIHGSKFRGGSDQEINVWSECSRFISNCIIYFNSAILSKLLKHYEDGADSENADLVKLLSPVAWTNVNLNGTYSFVFDSYNLDIDALLKLLTKNEKDRSAE